MSKKDISNFKLRKASSYRVRVTLAWSKDVRVSRQADFFGAYLVYVTFKGINEKSFDGRGNYTMGVTEQIIFPEIDIDKVNKITGIGYHFVTSA